MKTFEDWFAQSQWAGAGKDAGRIAREAWDAASETYQWCISPKMAEAKIDQLQDEISLIKKSRRDYFAAQALAGMCALEDNRTVPSDRRESVEKWRDELYMHDAMTAYRYADAMIDASLFSKANDEMRNRHLEKP